MTVSDNIHRPLDAPRTYPEPKAALTLIKPITWFPPMWAYFCGTISSGGSVAENWALVVLGVLLAGPIVCGMSQAANDWCDRHVDAINEPNRPIPSGRIPGRWGLWIALAMSALSLMVGALLGPWGFGATVVGVLAAWAYSAEPVRMKRSGWWGPGLVGLSYETLPWFTGAAILSAGAPRFEIVLVAMLYGIGAHGIMTLNDFKSVEGDLQMGIRSLPAQLGRERAAKVACVFMLLPQLVVIALLLQWQLAPYAAAVGAVVVAQCLAMKRLLSDPKQLAPWYNATGVSLYVLGMMSAAIGLGGWFA